MPTDFEPKLSILPDSQRRLWNELGTVPPSFVLCGGTAIALRLGHRSSYDFDFMASEDFDPDRLISELSFLDGGRIVQKAANTLTCVVDRGGPIQLSFFGTPSVRLIRPPFIARQNDVRIASLLDLSGMKAAVVQKRAEAKDYIDIDTIISTGMVDLPSALAAARALYGGMFNPELTLKSLCFFDDGDLHTLPMEVKNRLAAAVNAVDLERLPAIPATRHEN